MHCHCSCIVIPLYNIIIQIRPYQQMYGGDGDGIQCHVCSPVYTAVHSGNDNVICGRNAISVVIWILNVWFKQITPCDSHLHIFYRFFFSFFQFIKTDGFTYKFSMLKGLKIILLIQVESQRLRDWEKMAWQMTKVWQC